MGQFGPVKTSLLRHIRNSKKFAKRAMKRRAEQQSETQSTTDTQDSSDADAICSDCSSRTHSSMPPLVTPPSELEDDITAMTDPTSKLGAETKAEATPKTADSELETGTGPETTCVDAIVLPADTVAQMLIDAGKQGMKCYECLQPIGLLGFLKIWDGDFVTHTECPNKNIRNVKNAPMRNPLVIKDMRKVAKRCMVKAERCKAAEKKAAGQPGAKKKAKRPTDLKDAPNDHHMMEKQIQTQMFLAQLPTECGKQYKTK